MAKPPKVTVILTSYNHAKYLDESIVSVLNQTYPDFELIIWDDGSADESWQIIRSYADPRIRALRNPGTDRGDPIRRVLSQCETGEYIAIHHSDDAWEPQKLEKQVAFLDENPRMGAVFTQVTVIGENGDPFEERSHFYYSIFDQPNRTRHEWLNYFFYQGNALCHPSAMVRRSCYDKCGPYRYGMAHIADLDMWVRLCLKYEIYILPERLVRFRVRSNDLNSSADRPEQRVRTQFEYVQVLNNYRDLCSVEDFLKVFPSAEKYVTSGGIDLEFALGMLALEAKRPPFADLFGLMVLFEVLNDPGKAGRIRQLYGFGHTDFIALTAEHDIFSIEVISQLGRHVQSLTAQVGDLNLQLSEIYGSRSWKLAGPIRRLGRFFRSMRDSRNR